MEQQGIGEDRAERNRRRYSRNEQEKIEQQGTESEMGIITQKC